SGAALATREAPVMPPAPPTFSKSTGWPKSSESRDAKIRPKTSPALPAANGYTIVTSRVGHRCALDWAIVVTRAMTATIILMVSMIPLSPDRYTASSTMEHAHRYAATTRASGKSDHQAHRPRRIDLRLCDTRDRWQRGSAPLPDADIGSGEVSLWRHALVRRSDGA